MSSFAQNVLYCIQYFVYENLTVISLCFNDFFLNLNSKIVAIILINDYDD